MDKELWDALKTSAVTGDKVKYNKKNKKVMYSDNDGVYYGLKAILRKLLFRKS